MMGTTSIERANRAWRYGLQVQRKLHVIVFRPDEAVVLINFQFNEVSDNLIAGFCAEGDTIRSEFLIVLILSVISLDELPKMAGKKPVDVEVVASPAANELHLPSVAVGAGSPDSARLGRERLIDIVENYLTFYATGDGHTARAKRYDLQHFLEFLAGSSARVDQVLVDQWTLQTTKNFVDDRLARGEAPATVARRLATVKHLGRTLAERVHSYINPAREVKSPVLHATRPHGLDQDEIRLLQQAAANEVLEKNNSFIAVRNQALLELLLATGLRADEVRLLFVSQITEDLSWLKNVKTKGRKFRNVYLDSEIRGLLANYLAKRDAEMESRYAMFAQLGQAERGKYPVFISTYTAQFDLPASFGLAPKSVWRVISVLGEKANLLAESSSGAVGRLYPHKLRHTFAHGLLDSSKDVRLVAQALGHSDVRTTMRYTERADEHVAAAIENKVAKSKKS